MEMESALNAQRQGHDATYCLTRHIEVLIAIVAEARVMRTAQS